jgi:hypothetical protein
MFLEFFDVWFLWAEKRVLKSEADVLQCGLQNVLLRPLATEHWHDERFTGTNRDKDVLWNDTNIEMGG